MPSADLLRLAELLDGAGFAYLEVSGGGVFDTAVRRGVESPWERIRALKARTKTPLGMALRGRFLVGSRPVGGDFARRFVASAAESGIDVFRLEDPLNDVSNLREAGEAIAAADREFEAGLIYSPGPAAEKQLVEQAKKLPDLGAARVLLHDPSGALEPHRANELVTLLGGKQRAPRRPLLPGRRGQRAGGGAGGGARRRGSDRLRRVSDRAHAAPGLRRGPRQRSRRRRNGQRRRRQGALGSGRDRRRVHRRRPGYAARSAHRRAGRAARAAGGPRRRHRHATCERTGRTIGSTTSSTSSP